MTPKTSRSDNQLMEMIEKSGIPGLDLFVAEFIDEKDNRKRDRDIVQKRDSEVMSLLKSFDSKLDLIVKDQEITQKAVAKNTENISDNTKAITDIKIKNVVVVAVITAVSTIGGGLAVAYATGLFA